MSQPPSISTQFHALPEEMPELVSGLISDPAISIAGITGLGARPFDWHTGQRVPPVLVFTLAGPAVDAIWRADFENSNLDALVLEIGELTESGLSESWLWAASGDADVMRRWRRAAQALKKQTSTGSVAVNTKTSARGPYLYHRLSRGAQIAHQRGVVLRTPSPIVIVEPGESATA